MDSLDRLIVFRPRLVLVLFMLLTAFLGLQASKLRIDSSVETLLPRNSPEKTFYAETRKAFGSDEVGVVGIIAADIYTTATIEKIKRLTNAIDRVRGVASVLSITNALDYAASVALPPRLIPSVPKTRAELEALRRKLADRPLFTDNLVSPDGRAAAVNIFFEEMTEDEFLARGIDQTIERLVDREVGPEAIYYTGLPHLRAYSMKAMRHDLARLVPLTMTVIAVVLCVSFRSLSGVLLPTLTVIAALAWTLGLIALLGGHLSLASVALPPLMLVLGTAYSLHVLADYRELQEDGGDNREVVLETLRRATPPVFFTAVTTAVGFLSLAASPIVGIREMGLYSAMGIAVAFLFAVVFLPAILAWRGPGRRKGTRSFAPRLGAVLRWIGKRSIQHRGTVIALSAGVSLAAAAMVPSIRVDSNFESFFRRDDPVARATAAINEHLGGAMTFHLIVNAKTPGLLKKLEYVRRIRELQDYVESLPGVHTTISVADALDVVDRGSSGGIDDWLVTSDGNLVRPPAADETTTIWDDPQRFEEVMALVSSSPGSFSRLVTPDFSRANVLVRTSLSRSSDVNRLVGVLNEFGAGHLPPELTLHPTGTLVLHANTTRSIVAGQIRSLSLAAGVIFLWMSAMFLSLRVGLIAMVPNLFPIVVFFGLMGTADAVLSLSTSIIASIVLGIAVDDTVHLMTRLSAEVHRTGDQEAAMLHTLETVGKPCTFSTAFVSLGFLTLGLSTFVPVQQFGLLSAAAIVTALAGDLVLLPALVATTHIITLWNVLNVRLGKDPHKTIPVFETLRPIQAKIVALMGELKSYKVGTPIVRQGERGNEMYVILSGRAEVVLHTADETRSVRALERGDVFGEMGLVRQHERTADVIPTEDVEVMAMDTKFLTRVRERYPRTAAKIFLNLAKILSDRLEGETRRRAR